MRGIYLVGGYPDREGFKKAYKTVQDAGFDFIEVGLPFSDPVADGPVISSAALSVVESGISADEILADIKEVDNGRMKTYVMTYANIVSGYGLERFSADFGGVIEGAIIADVPNRMHGYFYDKGLTVPMIPFVTPESRAEDINDLKNARGNFIYFVGMRGITGGSAKLDSDENSSRIKQIKSVTDKPVVLGFGVKGNTESTAALSVADGYVVGTEAVKRQADLDKLVEFLAELA